MSTKFIDTNILLEAYFRKGEKSDKCLQLLKSDENLYASWLVIGEFEWVLRSVYELKRSEIVKLISSVINLSCLEIPDRKLVAQALKLFESLNLDWTDCLNAVLSRNLEIDEVYSYDRDFEKVKFLKRREP